MNKESNIFVLLNEGEPKFSKEMPILEDNYFILFFCFNCCNWYCLQCINKHNNTSNHYSFFIFADDNYYKQMKSFIYMFCIRLCLHNIKDIITEEDKEFNISNFNCQFEKFKHYIFIQYPHLVKRYLKMLKKKENEMGYKFNIINRTRIIKQKFLNDLFYTFRYIFECYQSNNDSYSILYGKVLNSIDFYEMIEFKNIKENNGDLYENKLLYYCGVRNKKLKNCTPIVEDYSIYLPKIVEQSILIYIHYYHNNTLYFHNLSNQKHLSLTFYNNSNFKFFSLWYLIQLENKILILAFPINIYFLKIINSETQFRIKIIKKILFEKQKIAFPINVNKNKFGLFKLKNEQFILSIYSYPFIHLFDLPIKTHSFIKRLDYFSYLNEERYITQFENFYIHFLDINMKEDIEICLFVKGEVTEMKQINDTFICLLIRLFSVVVLNVKTYQVNTIFDGIVYMDKLLIRRLPLNISIQELKNYIYEKRKNERLSIFEKIKCLSCNYYLYNITSRVTNKLFSYNQLIKVNNSSNLYYIEQ